MLSFGFFFWVLVSISSKYVSTSWCSLHLKRFPTDCLVGGVGVKVNEWKRVVSGIYFHRMEIEINFIDLILNPLHDYQHSITYICIDFIK